MANGELSIYCFLDTSSPFKTFRVDTKNLDSQCDRMYTRNNKEFSQTLFHKVDEDWQIIC